jgi:ADP-heptose:LPS heptosyltransferase
MNVDLMRKIDRWAGKPLCALLSGYERIARLAGPVTLTPEPPRHILFIGLAEIGALVVAKPALDLAEQLFPNAKLYFLTFRPGREMLDIMGLGPQQQLIIDAGKPGDFLRDTWRVITQMRRIGVDATVNLEVFARFSTILGYLSGAPRRVGFGTFFEEGLYTGDLVTHRVGYNPHVHAGRSYLSLVRALTERPGCNPNGKYEINDLPLVLPRRVSAPEGLASAMELLRNGSPALKASQRLVLLNPNASDLVAVRRWPLDYWSALIKGLLEDRELVIGLTGASSEKRQCEELRITCNSDRIVNLAGKTSLPQLLDLYNLAALLISNDSGPVHFSGLTRMPVLALFGPETPEVFGPLNEKAEVLYLGLACSPCVSVFNQKRSPCNDNLCLKRISPEEVLARARRIISSGPRLPYAESQQSTEGAI